MEAAEAIRRQSAPGDLPPLHHLIPFSRSVFLSVVCCTQILAQMHRLWYDIISRSIFYKLLNVIHQWN